MGLDPVVAPLFTIRPIAWTPPAPAGFGAVLLTSANAARLAGGGMTPFLSLPCYAVGERTAAAAREAGFRDIRTGPGDGEALSRMIAAEAAGAGWRSRRVAESPRDHALLELAAKLCQDAAI